jgi:Fusaric acid resistance protein-like
MASRAGDEGAEQPRDREGRAPSVVWDWSAAGLGVVYAIPAVVVMPVDVPNGLALAFGVLPAAIVGLAPSRRARVRVVVLGACMGVPIWLGSLLSGEPWLAVPAIGLIAVAAALLSTRSAIGPVVLNMSVAMTGIGLSFAPGKGAALMGLIIAGSVFAWLVSLLWPERPTPSAPPVPLAPASMLGYGLRLGAAGATAAAIGFAFDFDHVGWACAAALLVMRPSADMQRLRSVGRVLAVSVGALAAVGIAAVTSAPGWYCVVAIVAVAGAAATRGSRWYVTPAFTTLLAISLLVYSRPQDAGPRFGERVGETILGVAIAYLFGLLLPKLIHSQVARRAAS